MIVSKLIKVDEVSKRWAALTKKYTESITNLISFLSFEVIMAERRYYADLT